MRPSGLVARLPQTALRIEGIAHRLHHTVFIGDKNGYFYALDAATGGLKWQYPKAGDPPLRVTYGIESSAAYWDRPPNGAVIFAAQDPSLGPFRPDGTPYGSARLFALDAKLGTVIWPSDPIAVINGDPGNLMEPRQLLHYSPPLVFDNKVYVGIQSDENPIQIGRVIAVDLASGHKVGFQFQAVGTPASRQGMVRGGGVWNAAATDGTGVYFTTGNTRTDDVSPNGQSPEPNLNRGLSMIRVDKDTGNVIWQFQPVPYKLDDDPDWAAGAAVM
jgi:polyvinyl alcohol dehydrogenase (cytochrome)